MGAKRRKKKTKRKAAKRRVKRRVTKKRRTKKKAKRRKKAAKRTVKRRKTTKRRTKKKARRKKKAAKRTVKRRKTKKKAAKKKRKKRKPSAAFMKPVKPDAKLAAVVGAKPIPRTELTKKLWNYIKRNKLQDNRNRRMINADAKLKPVFGGKRQVSMFEMTKLVNRHVK